MPIWPGFDITSTGRAAALLSMTRDVGVPPTWPVSGSGDSATRSASIRDRHCALPTEAHGNGSHVTTSLLAERRLVGECVDSGGACGREVLRLHDRKHPQCRHERLSVRRRHLVRPPRHADKLVALAQAIGRTTS